MADERQLEIIDNGQWQKIIDSVEWQTTWRMGDENLLETINN